MGKKFQFSPTQEFSIAVGLGLVHGVSNFAAQGFSNALVKDVETDITTIPDSELDTSVVGLAEIYFPDNNGEAMEVVSDDINDTGPIQIFALGPEGLYIPPFILSLNGTTPVALPGLLSRINFARNVHPAGYDGTVTIRSVSTGNVFINMLEDNQNSTQARYTVPKNKKGLLKSATGSMRKPGGTDTAIALLIHVKPFNFDKFYHPFGFGLQRSGTTTIEIFNEYPDAIDGPFDVGVSANTSVSGAQAAARINGIIIDI